MDFNMSDRQKDWLNRVQSFMTKHVRPAVPTASPPRLGE